MAVRSKLQFGNKHYKMKFFYRLSSSTIKMYVLFNSFISFIKVFLKPFFDKKKKNVYPAHKPAAVVCIMFNSGEFLSISNFVWRASIQQNSHRWSKKNMSFWSAISQRNKYTCLSSSYKSTISMFLNITIFILISVAIQYQKAVVMISRTIPLFHNLLTNQSCQNSSSFISKFMGNT
jgi:hypothetical protein